MPDETSKSYMEITGERIAKIREFKNISQQKLAHESGVSRDTVRRIERGESGRMSDIYSICEYLNISILDIVPQHFHPQDKLAKLDYLLSQLEPKKQDKVINHVCSLVELMLPKKGTKPSM